MASALVKANNAFPAASSLNRFVSLSISPAPARHSLATPTSPPPVVPLTPAMPACCTGFPTEKAVSCCRSCLPPPPPSGRPSVSLVAPDAATPADATRPCAALPTFLLGSLARTAAAAKVALASASSSPSRSPTASGRGMCALRPLRGRTALPAAQDWEAASHPPAAAAATSVIICCCCRCCCRGRVAVEASRIASVSGSAAATREDPRRDAAAPPRGDFRATRAGLVVEASTQVRDSTAQHPFALPAATCRCRCCCRGRRSVWCCSVVVLSMLRGRGGSGGREPRF